MKIEETDFDTQRGDWRGLGLTVDWTRKARRADITWTFWRLFGSFRITWGEQDE